MAFMTFHILGITPTDFQSIIFQRGFAQNHQPDLVVIVVMADDQLGVNEGSSFRWGLAMKPLS